MFWILMTVLVLGITMGVLYPLGAIVFCKVYAFRHGKKATVRQIMNVIGY